MKLKVLALTFLLAAAPAMAEPLRILAFGDSLTEGYGPSARAFDTLKARGADLVITVDCGAAANEAVARHLGGLKADGSKMIVVEASDAGIARARSDGAEVFTGNAAEPAMLGELAVDRIRQDPADRLRPRRTFDHGNGGLVAARFDSQHAHAGLLAARTPGRQTTYRPVRLSHLR